MGSIVDSCSKSMKCCDCDDEKGYIRTLTENMTSDSGKMILMTNLKQKIKK